MRRTGAAMAAASLCLAGCATQYGASGLTGGYFDTRVNHRLVQVNFSGNGYITADKIQTFALYRCAELARNANKPYFVIYDSLAAAARDVPARQPRVGTLGGKPAAFAFMALEDEPRDGAQDVNVVLGELTPIVQAAPAVEGTQR